MNFDPTSRSTISEHFTWAEATVTTQRDASGAILANNPDPESARRLVHTFACGMESVRSLFHRPISVHSGYRSPQVNAAVRGSINSQHMRGEACDFHVHGFSIRKAFEIIARSNVRYDQLLEEGTWIHVSFLSDGVPRRDARVLGTDGVLHPYERGIA
jgi:hypothetical protein